MFFKAVIDSSLSAPETSIFYFIQVPLMTMVYTNDWFSGNILLLLVYCGITNRWTSYASKIQLKSICNISVEILEKYIISPDNFTNTYSKWDKLIHYTNEKFQIKPSKTLAPLFRQMEPHWHRISLSTTFLRIFAHFCLAINWSIKMRKLYTSYTSSSQESNKLDFPQISYNSS